VVVVFQETDKTPYSPKTISSHVNHVVVVVRPLKEAGESCWTRFFVILICVVIIRNDKVSDGCQCEARNATIQSDIGPFIEHNL